MTLTGLHDRGILPGTYGDPPLGPVKGPLYCRCTRTRAVRYPGMPAYLRGVPVRYLRRPKRVLTTEVSPGYLRGPTGRPCKGSLYCRCSSTRAVLYDNQVGPGTYEEILLGTYGDLNGPVRPRYRPGTYVDLRLGPRTSLKRACTT